MRPREVENFRCNPGRGGSVCIIYMKAKSFRFLTLLLAAAMLLVFRSRAQAAPVDLLHGGLAYHAGRGGPRLQRGHRADAMRQIEDAAKELGVKLHGDDKDHERQGISDEHLRQATKDYCARRKAVFPARRCVMWKTRKSNFRLR